MAVDERSRHKMFLKLEQVMGPEEATTLMEHLPPVGWSDVATKRDLDELHAATKKDLDRVRSDIEQLGVATKKDFDHLGLTTKRDIDELRAATKYDIDELRVATKHDADQLRVALDEFKVATQKDFEHIATLLETRSESTENKLMAHFRGEFIAQTRMMLLTMSSLMVTIAGLAFVALRLT